MSRPSLLNPGYEIEPLKKVSKSYPRMIDAGACPFKVHDGDSLAELAIFARMSSKNLLQYNFGTTDPHQVNWYLRNYVGCETADWDKKNYKFSNRDHPGVIFFPKRNYMALLDAGIKPTRIIEDEDYFVPGVVPHYLQMFGPLCWAASFGMMLAWKHGRQPLGDLLEEYAGLKWRRKFEKKLPIYSEEVEELATDGGLRGHSSCPASYDFWLQSIRKHGPLCIGQHVGSGWDHWIVANGYKKIFPDSRLITFKDPGRPKTDYDHVENIADRSKKYSYTSALPVFYHF